MPDKIRVRYAPSPTGFLHIGGARSALFNFLFAKHQDGTFVFRVEDTDVERNVIGGEASQLNDLIWLGIIPDESPEKPNPKYAPYRQTERLDTYHKYAQWLLEKGYAYECYCNEDELQKSRDEQLSRGIAAPQYDRHCLHLSEEQKQDYRKQGRVPCLRLKIQDHHEISFDDLVRGPVKFNNDDIGDWVIMKSNGIPTYNFAVVIDDHLMEISHVFRGEEHLSNTPKQIQLYEYFGWDIPKFGHMTIIVNENGKKLSKRDHDVLQFMSQYREMGFLPEAIMNFILLLGWTPEGNNEFFTMESAIKAFDAKRLSASPSTFDPNKMMWMNNHYMRSLDDASYLKLMKPFVAKTIDISDKTDEWILFFANLFKNELRYGAEIIELSTSIFHPLTNSYPEAAEVMNLESTPRVIAEFAAEVAKMPDCEPETVKMAFKNVQAKIGVKGKPLYMPIRLKLTGSLHGIEMANIIKIIGPQETLRRLGWPD